jgi:hypothetical protein
MEKITIANYYSKIQGIDWKTMAQGFKGGHDLVEGLHTEGTKDFSLYPLIDSETKATVDKYFVQLAEYLFKKKQPPATAAAKLFVPVAAKKQVKKTTPPAKPVAKAAVKRVKQEEDDFEEEEDVHYSERLPDEIRFIKRYISLHDKVKTKDDILRFINALQKSILEKRIRKTSEYAPEIEKIQKDLVKTYNTMKNRGTFVISEAAVKKYREKTAGERVYLSVQYLNKFRRIIGKPGIKSKAASLLLLIEKAIDSGRIIKKDPYYKQLHQAMAQMQQFVKTKKTTTLEISQQQLNGLNGIPGMGGLEGLDEVYTDRPQIMNSLDFVNLKFDTLGFTGKWRDFIGDPSRHFTAMVFGKPKFGKSFLCIDFAGYLARYHGNVLYVAKEETLDLTLQEKLKDKNVAHQNLTVAAELPANLAPYDFIFLDSVSKLGYTPQDLDRLKALNPAKSFVYIFQTTKDGNFRGVNSYQHDVDIVIEVPEPGLATQMGRFNQGGTMQIFD